MSSTDPRAAAPAPDPGDPDAWVVDLDQVVAVLISWGIEAVVDQTGGGCATIHAGPTRPHSTNPTAWLTPPWRGPAVTAGAAARAWPR